MIKIVDAIIAIFFYKNVMYIPTFFIMIFSQCLSTNMYEKLLPWSTEQHTFVFVFFNVAGPNIV